MYSKIRISIFSFLVMSLFIGLTSCGEDLDPTVDSIDVENFRGEGLDGELAESRRGGRGDCAELVFPVSVAFEDGTTASFDDRESMRDALKDYKEVNPEAERPSLVFPISVIVDETEVEVASQEDLQEIKEACRGERGGKGGKRGKGKCYQLQYPVSVTFEDGSTATYDDKESMKEALGEYKEANPEAERPSLVFPITIILDDTEVEVASAEELAEIREACRGERGGKGGHRGGKKCFQLVYPVSVTFEDGTTSTFEDKASMKAEFRAYKEANPEAERPALVYPVTVVDKEGAETVVTSAEEMDELKDSCRGERDEDDDDDDND